MIKKWKLFNFKSVRNETDLQIAPLTIFAGANSSGKSTFLQSLLLVAQTLAHKVSSRSVVLNGTLTRLGQFDDLKSYKSESDQIIIGWVCKPTEEAQVNIIENFRISKPVMFYGRNIESIKEITCKLSFDTNPGSASREYFQLQPQLFLFTMSMLVRTEENTDKRFEFTVSRSPSGKNKITHLKVEGPGNEVARAGLEYDIVLDDGSLGELREELTTAEPVGCVLSHFLPEKLSIRVNMVEEIARWIQMVLMDDMPRFRRIPFTDRELVVSNPLEGHPLVFFEKRK